MKETGDNDSLAGDRGECEKKTCRAGTKRRNRIMTRDTDFN